MKKRKLKKKIILLFIIIIMAIICFFIGRKIYIMINTFNVKVVDEIKDYNYSLDDRDSQLYKNYFEELKSVLSSDSVDTEKYAEIVAKMFIIDLYTIDNKVNKYDIPSLEFVYPDSIDNFKLKIQDTIYKYISDNTDKKRTQQLPIVTDINTEKITVEKFKIDDKTYDCYAVKLSWTYQTDLGYDKSGNVKLVQLDKHLYVVEYSNK